MGNRSGQIPPVPSHFGSVLFSVQVFCSSGHLSNLTDVRKQNSWIKNRMPQCHCGDCSKKENIKSCGYTLR